MSLLMLDWIAILRLGSRGVLIAILVAMAWLFLRNSRNFQQTLFSCLAAGFLILVISQLPGITTMVERLQDKDVTTLSRRLPLWISSLEHIKASPIWELFFGGGAGFGAQALGARTFSRTAVSPHNQYLETAMDYGLLGLASLVWLMVNGLRNSLKMKGYSGDIRTSIIVFMFVGFLTLTPLRYVLPWIAFGLTLSNPAEYEYKDTEERA